MAVGSVSDEAFVDAVNALIFAGGPCPSGDKIMAEVEKAKVRIAQRQRGGGLGYVDMLRDAAERNVTADPELVQHCLKLVEGFTARQRTISKEQFLQGCDLLEEVSKINGRANKGK